MFLPTYLYITPEDLDRANISTDSNAFVNHVLQNTQSNGIIYEGFFQKS